MMKRANSGIKPGDLVDMISALPDPILSLILSNLPTKDAVRTCLLSKRWEFLWKTVINLDFCHDYDCWKSEEPEHEAHIKFVRFVNSVLLLVDLVFLNKFRLVWRPKCIPSLIDSWISTAIEKNVGEIVLCAAESNRPFEVCRHVFNCVTLQSLELSGHMFVSDAVPVCLPRLQSLKLDSVCFQSEKAFEKLISGCPMLKYLDVHININKITEYFRTYEGLQINVFKFVVSSTSLRRLILKVYFGFQSLYQENYLHSNLELKASSLECLKLVGYISGIHVKESLSSLVEAHFGINVHVSEWTQSTVGDSLVKALRASTCAKALTLSHDSMMALTFATISPPTKLFKRLMKLQVGDDWCCPNLVEDIIQSSDKLEVLTLASKYSRCTECTIFDWTAPVEVPRCLSNSLKAVEFTCYTGFDYERDMVGYMLEHGSALEIMKLSCDNFRKDLKYEFIQEICKLPRKSPTCKIEFSG